jgi:hypothetical protein
VTRRRDRGLRVGPSPDRRRAARRSPRARLGRHADRHRRRPGRARPRGEPAAVARRGWAWHGVEESADTRAAPRAWVLASGESELSPWREATCPAAQQSGDLRSRSGVTWRSQEPPTRERGSIPNTQNGLPSKGHLWTGDPSPRRAARVGDSARGLPAGQSQRDAMPVRRRSSAGRGRGALPSPARRPRATQGPARLPPTRSYLREGPSPRRGRWRCCAGAGQSGCGRVRFRALLACRPRATARSGPTAT